MSRIVIYAVLAGLALCGQPAHANVLTADLNCILAGSNVVTCSPLFFFGTVTLEDSVNAGEISLTVDVQGYAGKFRDLMLNFDAASISAVTSDDGQASLLPDGYSLPPYHDGKFDIGRNGAKGWYSDSASFTTRLTGNLPLTLDMFDVRDSEGNLNVALLLQDPTSAGGTFKVGGTWEGGGPPMQENPEPATFALLGGGLILLAWASRRRKQGMKSNASTQ